VGTEDPTRKAQGGAITCSVDAAIDCCEAASMSGILLSQKNVTGCQWDTSTFALVWRGAPPVHHVRLISFAAETKNDAEPPCLTDSPWIRRFIRESNRIEASASPTGDEIAAHEQLLGPLTHPSDGRISRPSWPRDAHPKA